MYTYYLYLNVEILSLKFQVAGGGGKLLENKIKWKNKVEDEKTKGKKYEETAKYSQNYTQPPTLWKKHELGYDWLKKNIRRPRIKQINSDNFYPKLNIFFE